MYGERVRRFRRSQRVERVVRKNRKNEREECLGTRKECSSVFETDFWKDNDGKYMDGCHLVYVRVRDVRE